MLESLKLSLWEIFAYFMVGLMAIFGSLIFICILFTTTNLRSETGSNAQSLDSPSTSRCSVLHTLAIEATEKSKATTLQLTSCPNTTATTSQITEQFRLDPAKKFEIAGAVIEKLGAKDVLLLVPLILLIGALVEPFAAHLFRWMLRVMTYEQRPAANFALLCLQEHLPELKDDLSKYDPIGKIYQIAFYGIQKSGLPALYDVYLARFGFNRSAGTLCVIWAIASLVTMLNGHVSHSISIFFISTIVLAVVYLLRALDFFKLQGELIYFAYLNHLNASVSKDRLPNESSAETSKPT